DSADLAFASVTFPGPAPTYVFPGLQRVSVQLASDSAFDVANDVILPAFAQRLHRATDAHFLNGSGSGQPAGLLGAITSVTQMSTGHMTTADIAAYITAYFSLDAAYRTAPGCVWLMHSSTAKTVYQAGGQVFL